MGDRANVAIQDGGKRVYLYSHWGGYNLPATVQAALVRGKERWQDPAYLARIIFCEMVGVQTKELTGFGISTEIQDNEYPIIVVDCDTQSVCFEGEPGGRSYINDRKAVGKSFHFQTYCSLASVEWHFLNDEIAA